MLGLGCQRCSCLWNSSQVKMRKRSPLFVDTTCLNRISARSPREMRRGGVGWFHQTEFYGSARYRHRLQQDDPVGVREAESRDCEKEYISRFWKIPSLSASYIGLSTGSNLHPWSAWAISWTGEGSERASSALLARRNGNETRGPGNMVRSGHAVEKMLRLHHGFQQSRCSVEERRLIRKRGDLDEQDTTQSKK